MLCVLERERRIIHSTRGKEKKQTVPNLRLTGDDGGSPWCYPGQETNTHTHTHTRPRLLL